MQSCKYLNCDTINQSEKMFKIPFYLSTSLQCSYTAPCKREHDHRRVAGQNKCFHHWLCDRLCRLQFHIWRYLLIGDRLYTLVPQKMADRAPGGSQKASAKVNLPFILALVRSYLLCWKRCRRRCARVTSSICTFVAHKRQKWRVCATLLANLRLSGHTA